MSIRSGVVVLSLGFLTGCVASAPPAPSVANLACSAEAFAPFSGPGTGSVKGQAFLKTRGGEPRYASGETVMLVPATDCAVDWWNKAGRLWAARDSYPASDAFQRSVRKTVADATGNFELTEVPPGMYYIRTQVTWEVPDGNSFTNDLQGGIVGDVVTIEDGKSTRVMLTWK